MKEFAGFQLRVAGLPEELLHLRQLRDGEGWSGIAARRGVGAGWK